MELQLSDDSKQVLREILERQDRDENGWFDDREFRRVLKNMGFNPSREDLDFLIKHLDSTGDGKLEIDDVMDSLDVINQHSINGAQLMEAFQLFDINKDGFIRKNELKLVLTMPGPDKMRPDEADDLIAELLKKYDTNNDQKFSYGEFVRMFTDDALPAPRPASPQETEKKRRKTKSKAK